MIGLLAESAVNTRGPDAAAGRARKITRGLALLSQQETTIVLVEASKLAVMADESVFRVPAMDIQQNWQEVLRYTLAMRVVSPAVLLACIYRKRCFLDMLKFLPYVLSL